MITCDEEAVDDEIDGQEIVLKHLESRKSASEDPKQTMDPYRLPHVSLMFPS